MSSHSHRARHDGKRARGRARSERAWQGSSPFTQVLLLTRRSVLSWLTDPAAVMLGAIQPIIVMFLVLGVFANVQVTGNLPPGTTYFDYVLPAILVDNAVQTSVQPGVGLVDDLDNGIVARLRSLPVLPGSLLVARSITGVVRTAFQVAIILTLAGTVLGHYPRGGAVELAVSVGLTLLIGWSLGWVFLAAATFLRRAEPMQNLAMVVIFPLMFASSAYVPVSDLPGWLAAFARVNPLTYAINATRALALDSPDGGARTLVPAVVISLVIAALGFLAATIGFRRPDRN